MWLTIEFLGVTILAVGLGPRSSQQWISNTGGEFELVPQESEEAEEWDDRGFGFSSSDRAGRV